MNDMGRTDALNAVSQIKTCRFYRCYYYLTVNAIFSMIQHCLCRKMLTKCIKVGNDTVLQAYMRTHAKLWFLFMLYVVSRYFVSTILIENNFLYGMCWCTTHKENKRGRAHLKCARLLRTRFFGKKRNETYWRNNGCKSKQQTKNKSICAICFSTPICGSIITNFFSFIGIYPN